MSPYFYCRVLLTESFQTHSTVFGRIQLPTFVGTRTWRWSQRYILCCRRPKAQSPRKSFLAAPFAWWVPWARFGNRFDCTCCRRIRCERLRWNAPFEGNSKGTSRKRCVAVHRWLYRPRAGLCTGSEHLPSLLSCWTSYTMYIFTVSQRKNKLVLPHSTRCLFCFFSKKF